MWSLWPSVSETFRPRPRHGSFSSPHAATSPQFIFNLETKKKQKMSNKCPESGFATRDLKSYSLCTIYLHCCQRLRIDLKSSEKFSRCINSMGVVAERCSLLNNPITEGVVNHYPVLSFDEPSRPDRHRAVLPNDPMGEGFIHHFPIFSFKKM